MPFLWFRALVAPHCVVPFALVRLIDFVLPLIPNGYALLCFFLRSSLYFYYCYYYYPWTMHSNVHCRNCKFTTLLERSCSEVAETGTFKSANWGRPDPASYSHGWPDMGPSGRLGFIRPHLARRGQICNLGIRSVPPLLPTGQIFDARSGVRPDLFVPARRVA